LRKVLTNHSSGSADPGSIQSLDSVVGISLVLEHHEGEARGGSWPPRRSSAWRSDWRHPPARTCSRCCQGYRRKPGQKRRKIKT